jgi:hypothetical protein
MPTSAGLVLRVLMAEAASEFVSSAGECTVTFVNVNADVIDGTFVCVQVPPIEGKRKADVTGTFSFAP